MFTTHFPSIHTAAHPLRSTLALKFRKKSPPTTRLPSLSVFSALLLGRQRSSQKSMPPRGDSVKIPRSRISFTPSLASGPLIHINHNGNRRVFHHRDFLVLTMVMSMVRSDFQSRVH